MNHYQREESELQPLHVFRVWEHDPMTHYESFCRYNALKYLWRYPLKAGVDDIDKCIHYLELLKDELLRKNR